MHFAICMAGPFCRPALHCRSSNRERQKTLSGPPKPVGGKAGTETCWRQSRDISLRPKSTRAGRATRWWRRWRSAAPHAPRALSITPGTKVLLPSLHCCSRCDCIALVHSHFGLHRQVLPPIPHHVGVLQSFRFFLKFAQEEAPPASRSYSCCCLGDDAPTSEMGWFGPRAQGTSERQGRRLG